MLDITELATMPALRSLILFLLLREILTGKSMSAIVTKLLLSVSRAAENFNTSGYRVKRVCLLQRKLFEMKPFYGQILGKTVWRHVEKARISPLCILAITRQQTLLGLFLLNSTSHRFIFFFVHKNL